MSSNLRAYTQDHYHTSLSWWAIQRLTCMNSRWMCISLYDSKRINHGDLSPWKHSDHARLLVWINPSYYYMHYDTNAFASFMKRSVWIFSETKYQRCHFQSICVCYITWTSPLFRLLIKVVGKETVSLIIVHCERKKYENSSIVPWVFFEKRVLFFFFWKEKKDFSLSMPYKGLFARIEETAPEEAARARTGMRIEMPDNSISARTIRTVAEFKARLGRFVFAFEHDNWRAIGLKTFRTR